MTHPDELLDKPARKVAIKPRSKMIPEKRNIRDTWFYRSGDYLVGELRPLWDNWVTKRIGTIYEYGEVFNGVQKDKKEQKEKQVKTTTKTRKQQ